MTSVYTFTNNITPPQSLSISQKNQPSQQYSSSSPIFVEIQNQTQSQSKHTQTSKLWPRTRIQQMIRMVWHSTCALIILNILNIFPFFLNKNSILEKFIHEKQNKYLCTFFLLYINFLQFIHEKQK